MSSAQMSAVVSLRRDARVVDAVGASAGHGCACAVPRAGEDGEGGEGGEEEEEGEAASKSAMSVARRVRFGGVRKSPGW